MYKRFAIILVSIFSISTYGQVEKDKLKHALGMQILGQALFSFQYEYSIISKNKFRLSTDVGLGLAEFSNDDPVNPKPSTKVIHTGLMAQYGFDFIKGYVSFQPSSYFYGKFSFVNINANIGVRIMPKFFDTVYLMIGYTPSLYSSLTTTEYIFTETQFCLRFGFYL